MAYYKPCKNCAADKAACSRRAEVSKAISGLHVAAVNFRCHDRRPLFHAGQRVSFNWTFWEPGDGYEGDHGIGLIFHGTVIEERGLRFIVRVDDGPSADGEKIEARDTFKSENLVIKVKPANMIALDEPDRVLCAACGGREGEDSRCHGWEGVDRLDSYWPSGCLVQTAGG